MRAVLAPVGTRGDVQPMLALGVALRRAGHEVSVCVAENHRASVEAVGLPYVRGGDDSQQLMTRTDIEVRGALRRRFWRAGGGAVSRSEVEVVQVRRAPGSG